MPVAGAGMTEPGAAANSEPAPVLVWDFATRLFHWGLVAAVLTAWFTGGSGHISHEISGCVVAGLIVFRLIWGLTGTRYARFTDFVKSPRTVWRYAGDIARNRASRHLGHNPAGGSMILALLGVLGVIVVSGSLILTNAYFGVSWVETLHGVSAYGLMLLIPLHVLGVVIASRHHRENLARAMFSGWKAADAGATQKGGMDDRFRDELLTRIRGNEGTMLLFALVMGGLAYGWVLTSGRISKPAAELGMQTEASLLDSRGADLSGADPKGRAAISLMIARTRTAQDQIGQLQREVERMKGVMGRQEAEILRLASLIHGAAAAPNLAAASSGRSSGCDALPADRPAATVLQFARNGIDLDSSHQDRLDSLMELAGKCANARIEITGYSDTTGPAAVNLRLSKKRAEAAASYLTERGLELPRLKVSARGSEQSAASNNSREGRASNRRVEIVLNLVR
jgi:cytochrome b/outer membrane protein OmpA-like peptidoglycan-associated protein